MKISQQQIDAVLGLPGEERYRHFIKRVADTEVVWALFSDGWLLAETTDGTPVFPLWPAREYAQLCAEGDWAGAEPREIELNELLETWLPEFSSNGTLPGVFYTPNNKGVTPSVGQLQHDIEKELENY